jgi:hypothetical protein
VILITEGTPVRSGGEDPGEHDEGKDLARGCCVGERQGAMQRKHNDAGSEDFVHSSFLKYPSLVNGFVKTTPL